MTKKLAKKVASIGLVVLVLTGGYFNNVQVSCEYEVAAPFDLPNIDEQ